MGKITTNQRALAELRTRTCDTTENVLHEVLSSCGQKI